MMSSSKSILDASAVIALLSEEEGADEVYSVITHSVMSSVNVSEVAKFLIEHRKFSKTTAIEAIQTLISEIIPFDENHAYVSADLITKTKSIGLSLGDRACIALGIETNYPIYTADKVWSKIDFGCQINLIR
ncbi:type II toxin-antitoxin system VapC family toxin [Rickettsiaceae bacterium]|nr:type II toxin-antitoxin system VapC family toxin [Rickettsiaceae bacterium]